MSHPHIHHPHCGDKGVCMSHPQHPPGDNRSLTATPLGDKGPLRSHPHGHPPSFGNKCHNHPLLWGKGAKSRLIPPPPPSCPQLSSLRQQHTRVHGDTCDTHQAASFAPLPPI